MAGVPRAFAEQRPALHSPQQLAHECEGRQGWSDRAPPARLTATLWYVGTCGITALLLTDPKGDILIDGGVEEAATLVLDNVRKLGFDPKAIRWIIASHEHYDHVGALAFLKRKTGAKVAATAVQAATLRTGAVTAEDPQFGTIEPFAPVAVDRVLTDGEPLTLGKLVVTAHETPVHAPGSTSWTWQTCSARDRCLKVAYADSASTISADGYRFSDHPARIAKIREGLDRIAALPCDLLLTPHPSASAMMERLADKKLLIAPDACRTYATEALRAFNSRLAMEAVPATHPDTNKAGS